MAITTLAGAVAGLQMPQYINKTTTTPVVGRPATSWASGTFPVAGTYPATLAGSALTGPVTGQIARTDPPSGNAYLGRLQIQSTRPGTLMLCDRLWHNGTISLTTTTAQTFTTPTWPARDANGSTNGVGVQLMLEITTATTTNTPVVSIAYTDSDGNSATANLVETVVAANAIGSCYRVQLAAGDVGVRSVQSITIPTTWGAGVASLVAYRPLAVMEINSALTTAIDAFTSGFPQIYNGSVPYFVWFCNVATAPVFSGSYIETQG